MTSVEEMLEGYEWASDDVIGRKTVRGTADLIEARLLDELMALEKVSEACSHISNIVTYSSRYRPTSTRSWSLTIE